MGGCTDVNGSQLTITNKQLGRLVEAGQSNEDLQALYEPREDGDSGYWLTGHVCRVTQGPFEDAIITDSNNLIVGTYDDGALNWGSYNPLGRDVNFFGEELNVAFSLWGRKMLVLDGGYQWTPEAAATIRGLLGTEAGHDPHYRVYFDTTTGSLAINTRVGSLAPDGQKIRAEFLRFISRLIVSDASELPGISEDQRQYLLDVLSAELRMNSLSETTKETNTHNMERKLLIHNINNVFLLMIGGMSLFALWAQMRPFSEADADAPKNDSHNDHDDEPPAGSAGGGHDETVPAASSSDLENFYRAEGILYEGSRSEFSALGVDSVYSPKLSTTGQVQLPSVTIPEIAVPSVRVSPAPLRPMATVMP